MGQTASTEPSKQKKIDQIKVAYLVNFIRFTTWPDAENQQQDAPLVITLIDDSDFPQMLSNALSDGKLDEHPVQIQVITKLRFEQDQIVDDQKKRLLASHVIYDRSTSNNAVDYLRRLEDKPSYLLLGDMKNFAENGGMIGFVETSAKVSFTVNLKVIRESRILISSKVLRLGMPVRTKS